MFVLKLLRVEPSERMTLVEAMEHPWLKEAVAEVSSSTKSAGGGAKSAATSGNGSSSSSR